MFEAEKELLWAEDCQPLTTAQMNNAKAQFHPSNTANVNIVSYEIYDEDGSEIVVGEVRKTIDGVKKKKPLYQKYVEETVSADSESSTLITNVDYATCKNMSILTTSNTILSPSSYSTYNIAGAGTNAGFVFRDDNGNVKVGNSNRINSEIIMAVIQYTKTTDTWQPV